MSISRAVIFFSVVTLIATGIHTYLWWRLVQGPNWSPGAKRWLTVGLVLCAVSFPASMAAWRLLPRAVSVPMVWFAYVWIGVMFYLLVTTVGAEFVSGFRRLVQGPVDVGRRESIARVTAMVIGGISLSASLWGLARVLRGPEVVRQRIAFSKWPASLAGFRVVQLTDIHVGPTIGAGFLRTVVSKVNALRPDLIVITGDLVDGRVEQLAASVAPLSALSATHGVYFVTGNHEYFSGVDEWREFLPTLNVRVLSNERVSISADGATFDLIGIEDATADRFGGTVDLARALHGRDTSEPSILLAHQPKAIFEASTSGIDLQISGHTHGGQIAPFGYLAKVDQPFLSGLHQMGSTQVYVSEGTGYWGPPMRVGTRCEITLLELHSA